MYETIAVCLYAFIFGLLYLMNNNDPRKGSIALIFFILHIVNVFLVSKDVNFYQYAIYPPFFIALISLSLSLRNWSLAICGIMTSCIFINILGRLNFEHLNSDVGYMLYSCATLLTGFAEIGVLWAMSYGKLDGYFNDYLAKRGDNKLRSIFVSSDNHDNHKKVSTC